MSFIILKATNSIGREQEISVNINRISFIAPLSNGKCKLQFNQEYLTVNHSLEELIEVLPFSSVSIPPSDGGFAHIKNKPIYRPGDEKVEPQ